MKALFVCSMGKYRSRTAAIVCNKYFESVSFGGTDKYAENKIIKDDIHNSDIIFCMEQSHSDKLRLKYKSLSHKIVVLDIPDDYGFLQGELCHLLEIRVTRYLKDRGLLDSIWED